MTHAHQEPLGLQEDEVEPDVDASTPALPRVAWTRFGGVTYALFWLTYALGFSALDWIRSGGPTWRALSSTLIVLAPAALLGLAVVALCNRVDIAANPRRVLGLHGVLAIAFPFSWVASVLSMNTLLGFARTGAFTLRLPPEHVLHWHYLTGVLMYLGLALATYGLRFARAESVRRQRAELDALRAQLSPHFLFNALHTLFALSHTDPDRGEVGISRLASLLRYSLREASATVPLRTDWSMCEEYLHLEQLRFGDRLQWRASLPANALTCEVPPFLIQPLLENAVHHALRDKSSAVTIQVCAEARNGALEIRVSDDGPGASTTAPTAGGIGLRSVATRLENLLPVPGSLTVSAAPGRGYSATILLPTRR